MNDWEISSIEIKGFKTQFLPNLVHGKSVNFQFLADLCYLHAMYNTCRLELKVLSGPNRHVHEVYSSTFKQIALETQFWMLQILGRPC